MSIPDEAMEAAAKAVRSHLINYTLPANYWEGRSFHTLVAGANSDQLARLALEAAAPFMRTEHDFGDFDRTVCPCGIMHAYCTDCGQPERPHHTAAETFTHPTTPTAADKAAKPSARTQKEQL